MSDKQWTQEREGDSMYIYDGERMVAIEARKR